LETGGAGIPRDSKESGNGKRKGYHFAKGQGRVATTKFEGKCEDLKGAIYDCSNARHADVFVKTTQETRSTQFKNHYWCDFKTKQKCLSKVSPHSSSWKNTNLHPNCCEWYGRFTKLVLCYKYIFHIGVRHFELLIAKFPFESYVTSRYLPICASKLDY
jgi:hypothetical protein